MSGIKRRRNCGLCRLSYILWLIPQKRVSMDYCVVCWCQETFHQCDFGFRLKEWMFPSTSNPKYLEPVCIVVIFRRGHIISQVQWMWPGYANNGRGGEFAKAEKFSDFLLSGVLFLLRFRRARSFSSSLNWGGCAVCKVIVVGVCCCGSVCLCGASH